MNTITRRAAKRTAGLICGLFALLSASPGQAQPIHTVDLASTPTNNSGLQRVYGSVGTGVSGVPVAGGHDVDGDGHRDYAFAAMRADPLGRSEAGQVFLVFGNGSIDGTIDSAVPNPRVLTIIGDQCRKMPARNCGWRMSPATAWATS
jgi:hypothetical protein